MGETKALDIQETLREWCPHCMSSVKSGTHILMAGVLDAFDKLSHFNVRIQHNDSDHWWRPPGSLIESYTRHDRQFEIWRAELTDPAVKLLLERMQIFVSLFIEAGTPLELDDQEWTLARWRVFFV